MAYTTYTEAGDHIVVMKTMVQTMVLPKLTTYGTIRSQIEQKEKGFLADKRDVLVWTLHPHVAIEEPIGQEGYDYAMHQLTCRAADWLRSHKVQVTGMAGEKG